MLWYQNETLTILDPSRAVYSTLSVPGSIDGMLEQVAKEQDLTIPLSDLAFSDPCQNLRKEIIFGEYIGVNDVSPVSSCSSPSRRAASVRRSNGGAPPRLRAENVMQVEKWEAPAEFTPCSRESA